MCTKVESGDGRDTQLDSRPVSQFTHFLLATNRTLNYEYLYKCTFNKHLTLVNGNSVENPTVRQSVSQPVSEITSGLQSWQSCIRLICSLK